jgi:hypothetical protein
LIDIASVLLIQQTSAYWEVNFHYLLFLMILENTTKNPSQKGKINIWFFNKRDNFQLPLILVVETNDVVTWS